MELLGDWAERDPNAFHRFLWSNHLGYAETYEVERRFGLAQIHPTRLMFFADLESEVKRSALEHGREVESVFEVGCSLGYLLRHLETGLFRQASVLEGIDIDRYAVEQGQAYLIRIGSRIRLQVADMGDLPRILTQRRFDVTFAAGVLMYLRQEEAAAVVATMLRHTGLIAAFAGLADPNRDNRELAGSTLRARDGTFIHNIDEMIARAGGRVLSRRWEGARSVDGNTIYFVFCRPANA